MNFSSSLHLSGTLIIRVYDVATNKILRTIVRKNCITLNASDMVRALLAQRATDATAAEYAWGSMRFGTGSTTPVREDLDLITEVNLGGLHYRKQLTDTKKVDGTRGVITLLATLDAGDANGAALQEAAVFSRGSGAWDADVGGSLMMYSRQIHPLVTKIPALRLEYAWVMMFTA